MDAKQKLFDKFNELRALFAQAKCDGVEFNLEEAPTLVDAEVASVLNELEGLISYYVD